MAQVCQRCSRTNPADAVYCYHDGVVLLHGSFAGPIQFGLLPFPRPFPFPSGPSCVNFDQLAWACQERWPAAVELLRGGEFQRFLGAIGRADLVRVAAEAANFPDPDQGLDRLLESFPSDALTRPRLHVSPTDINLGRLVIGQDRPFHVSLANQGMRLLHGSVQSDAAWLSLGDRPGVSQRLVQFQHDLNLTVLVCGKAIRASNKPLEGHLSFETNGGSATVVVRAEAPVVPFAGGALAGARSPREIAERARSAPHAAAEQFENGAVARWYDVNGWTYPIQGPTAAGIGAVQQFFEAVGLSTPPKVDISERIVQLTGRPGDRLEHALTVSTHEKRAVYASASSEQAWLSIGATKTDGRTALVPLLVPAVPSQPGETLLGRVLVRTNGNQQFAVAVRLAIAGTRLSVPSLPMPEPIALAPEPIELTPEAIVATAPIPAWSKPASHVARSAVVVPDRVPPLALATEPARLSAAVPIPVAPAPTRGGSGWLHAIPLLLLALTAAALIFRDAQLDLPKPEQVDVDPGKPLPDEPVVIAPVDLAPRIEVRFSRNRRFGVSMLADGDERGKKLTYAIDGNTNDTCVKINGREGTFGEDGSWKKRAEALGTAPDGRQRIGESNTFLMPPDIEVTQIIEVVPGDQAVEIKPGEYRRLLNTCLIRYILVNKGQQTRRVGVRHMLDTFIGKNDGVPFTIPGRNELVSTYEVFNDPKEVPDFIQALEYPNLQRPGTIAHLTLRLSDRLEPPDRVLLTRWKPSPSWEIPLRPIGDDSCCVLYWSEKELKPNERREIGFAYGLGNVASDQGGGALAVTLAKGVFKPSESFDVTAYVNNPLPDETVTLDVPAGFSLEKTPAKQKVPPVGAGAATRNSVITWRVTAANRQGNFKLNVKSSRGVAQAKNIIVAKPSETGPDPGIFR